VESSFAAPVSPQSAERKLCYLNIVSGLTQTLFNHRLSQTKSFRLSLCGRVAETEGQLLPGFRAAGLIRLARALHRLDSAVQCTVSALPALGAKVGFKHSCRTAVGREPEGGIHATYTTDTLPDTPQSIPPQNTNGQIRAEYYRRRSTVDNSFLRLPWLAAHWGGGFKRHTRCEDSID
jgi:hypothetical protein